LPRHTQTPGRVLYECVEPFAVFQDDIPEVYGNGRMVLADDPILRTHGPNFVPAADRVEQATHRPGEIRNTHIPSEVQPVVPDQPIEPVVEEIPNG
jgi:hypothetical protein